MLTNPVIDIERCRSDSSDVKLCEVNELYAELCPCLMGETAIRVSYLLRTIVNSLEPTRLDQFIDCSNRYCSGEPLSSLFSYFKIFRDVPEFQRFINDPNLSVSLLENYIIHLMGFCHSIGQSRVEFFNHYLHCLSQQSYVRLLRNARFLYRDVDFFTYCLIKLDSDHVGMLMDNNQNIQQTLTDIVLNFPEERIRAILSRNPDIYNYCIHYLEQDQKQEEAKLFRERYSRVIEIAATIQDAVRYISDLNQLTLPLPRGQRAEKIISRIKETRHISETLAVLDYNHVFLDDYEKQIVHHTFGELDYLRF